MKQKEKQKDGLAGHGTYQSPMTYRNRVEVEGGICADSADIENPYDPDNGRINEHTINTSGPSLKDDNAWD